MAIVTGSLRDFTTTAIPQARAPRIVFTPSGAGTTTTRLLASIPVVVTPDTSGAFSVDLAPTDQVMPAVYYRIRIEWLDASGGFVGVDIPDWSLAVPSSGGSIGDLLTAPANSGSVWIGLDPPPKPVPGTWWLQTDINNPDDPRNTGILYEWR